MILDIDKETQFSAWKATGTVFFFSLQDTEIAEKPGPLENLPFSF